MEVLIFHDLHVDLDAWIRNTIRSLKQSVDATLNRVTTLEVIRVFIKVLVSDLYHLFVLWKIKTMIESWVLEAKSDLAQPMWLFSRKLFLKLI